MSLLLARVSLLRAVGVPTDAPSPPPPPPGSVGNNVTIGVSVLTIGSDIVSVGSSTAVSPPPPSPPPEPPPTPAPVIAGKTALGVNAPFYTLGETTPGPVNMVKGGIGFQVYPAVDAMVSVDANGWPTTDFRTGPAIGETFGAAHQITVSWNGQATVQWLFAHDGAGPLSAVAYDSATNRSTVTFTYTPGPWGYPPVIQFGSTKRTPTSSTPSGLTNIDWRRTSDVGSTKVWKTELVNYLKDFATCIRMMDLQSTNNDRFTTTWASRSKGRDTAGTPEDCIALANDCGTDCWMQIPTDATADWDNGFFAYAAANLNPGLNLYFGYSNETWNNSFSQTHTMYARAATEVKGAIGGEQRGILSMVRTSNVVTVTVNYTVDLSVGQHVDVTSEGDGSFAGNFTITSVSTNSFTYNQVGANASAPIAGNLWFVNTEANSGSSLAPGIHIYAKATSWAIRRLLQAAERCRVIVGDAAMLTRFRPIIEDQMVNNDGAFELDYAKTFVQTSLGVPWANQKHVYGFAGAPYHEVGLEPGMYCDVAFGTCPTVTPTQYANAYATRMAAGRTEYRYAERGVTALRFGVKLLCYEGGANNFYNPGAINKQNMIAAKASATFGAANLQSMKDMGSVGMSLFMHYYAVYNAYDWGYTDSRNNVTGYWQSYRDYRDLSSGQATNPLSGTIGTLTTVNGRLWAGSWSTSSPIGGLGLSGNNTLDMIVTVASAGVYSLVLDAAINTAGDFSVEVNGTVRQTAIHMTPNNSAGSLSTFSDMPAFTLSLPAGLVAIRFTAASAHWAGNTWELFRNWKFTRVS
jgi:hypothetical protein